MAAKATTTIKPNMARGLLPTRPFSIELQLSTLG